MSADCKRLGRQGLGKIVFGECEDAVARTCPQVRGNATQARRVRAGGPVGEAIAFEVRSTFQSTVKGTPETGRAAWAGGGPGDAGSMTWEFENARGERGNGVGSAHGMGCLGWCAREGGRLGQVFTAEGAESAEGEEEG
jgi:hypothetical protein